MDPDLYILSWQIILGGSSAKFWQLIKRFGSAKEAWQVSEKALLAEKLFEPDQLAEINKRRLAFSFEYWQRLMEQKEIIYLDYQSKEYPDSLKNIYNSPPGLFMRGNPELLHRPMLAMVGARRPTSYGLSVARKFGREIAEAGVIVVSGLAKGIDAAAHEGALSGGGSTLAILGCGVDVAYPRENKNLMDKIVQKGAVISEFPPGSAPQSWHFPVRNRLISGLSRAVLVVEASAKSGSLITADLALEQGRDVMAIPGNINSALSMGTNHLIRQGASIITSVEEVLEELGISVLYDWKKKENVSLAALTPEEEEILARLGSEPVPLDCLIEGHSPQAVIANLVLMEVKGLIRQLPGDKYVRN